MDNNLEINNNMYEDVSNDNDYNCLDDYCIKLDLICDMLQINDFDEYINTIEKILDKDNDNDKVK
tara:strand:- start:42 stop:236 length:195 start_codon:yes stop_codon:yes gene_type:complete